MQTQNSDSCVGERQLAASPALAGNDHRHYQETSHVFYCMQCDLHVQTDIAVVRRNGSHESEGERIRVRLDPHTTLQQGAGSIVPRVVEREVDRARREGEEEAFCRSVSTSTRVKR